MKALLRPIKFILSHPTTKNNKLKGLVRFINWQIKSRVNKREHIINWFNGIKLNVKKGMYGATGCIYVGLPEFEDMSFVLHFLNQDDLFLDIGANVGVYSLLAAGVKKTNTIAFEPVPSTFLNLEKNISINNLKNIEILNIGLADKDGELHFTSDGDTNNHVINEPRNNSIKVSVKTLDKIIHAKENTDILIKLDVEGFEIKVLEGSNQLLKNENLMGLIVELNGCSKRYGFKDSDVDQILTQNGFNKFEYNPFNRKLIEIDQFHNEKNTLYLRKSKLNHIQNKLNLADSFQIFGNVI